ncbi:MAG: hypothetical protein GY930_10195 [bacterium]|nr:hypothetical protein [bacterium]
MIDWKKVWCWSLSATLGIPLLCALGPDTLAATPAIQEAAEQAKGYTDKQLKTAWKRLSSKDQDRAAEWFSSEARQLPCFQNTLIAFIKGSLDKDPYDWPKATPGPSFDPEIHAPAQPIPRVPQDPNSAEYKAQYESLLGWKPARRLHSVWQYNYATQTVESTGPPNDPEVVFQNGLAGFLPDLDLAEAICQSHLDDGSLVDTHRAFAHTYAIRSGHSYPGISLFDAWSSGRKIEMPDVECLGLLHTLENDWKSFVAPVRKQDPLYKRIEKLYVPIQRQRALQEALARCYLQSTPVLDAGYGGTEDLLSDLWEQNESTPAQVKLKLPSSKGWKKWMEKGQKLLRTKKKRREAAMNRRAYLAQGERAVRSIWVMVLEGMGTLNKK